MLIKLIAKNIRIEDMEKKSRTDNLINLEGNLYMYNEGLILKSDDKIYAIPIENINNIKRNKHRKGIELFMGDREFLITNHGSQGTYRRLEALRHYYLPYIIN